MIKKLYYWWYDYLMKVKCVHIDVTEAAHRALLEKGEVNVPLFGNYEKGEVIKINGLGYVYVETCNSWNPSGRLYKLKKLIFTP